MEKIGPWLIAALAALVIVVLALFPSLTDVDVNVPVPGTSSTSTPLVAPAGFTISIFADNVPGARVMLRDPKGALLVSQTSEGRVVALPNYDADLKADRTVTVLAELRRPHGLLMRCPETGNESADQDACRLYIAEEGRVTSYAYDADTFMVSDREIILELPEGDGHFTRTLLQDPEDGRLLVSVGSSCNVCNESDPRRATIVAIDLKTKETEVFARGLRNTVFMTIHPVDGAVWGTEMGRDHLGDDLPPDEVNILRAGADYGWPRCYGENILDTNFVKAVADAFCRETLPSHIDIPAHSAPLGLTFVPEEGWPEEWWFDLLVAYHGSWNRSTPTGYKIVRFDLDLHGNLRSPTAFDFVTGFMEEDGDVIGRPVDLLIEPGGVLYISDDKAGTIYRMSRISE